MPVEVIDLLSSPDPVRNSKPFTKAPAPSQNQHISTIAPHIPIGGVWLTLSSDDEDGVSLPPLPKSDRTAHPAPSTKSAESLRVMTNTCLQPKPLPSLNKAIPQSANTPKQCNDFLFLSEDFDSTIDLDHSMTLPPSNSVGILGLNRKQMEEERLARINKTKTETDEHSSGTNYAAAELGSTSLLRNLGSDDPFELGDMFSKRKPSVSPPRQMEPPSRQFDNGIRDLTKRKPSATFLLNSEDDPFELDLPPLKKQQRSSNLLPKGPGPKPYGYKRSISNFETSSKETSTNPKASGLARSKSTIVELDPIMFTSSPDYHAEAAKRRKEKRLPAFNKDEDEDVFGFGSSNASPEKKWGTRAVSLDNSSDSLPDINTVVSKNAARKTKKPLNSSLKSPDILGKYHADKERDKKAQEKAQEKAQKAKEKEDEKERKLAAKEEKAKVKESAAFLAKANILKVDKKVSTPEMIVGLPSSLKEKVKDATRTFLADLSVKTYDYDSDLPVIKWKRRVEAIWDLEARIFRPCEVQIKEEKHVMYVMSAEDFVQLATGEEGNDLDSHVLRLKTTFQSHELIYLIEGLGSWLRKNKAVKNRGFTEAVRKEMNPVDLSTSQKARKRKVAQYIDEDMVEHALLKLQVIHSVLIHHSQVMENTPEWIRSFTQHISTIPYKYAHHIFPIQHFFTSSNHM